eukprot:941828-Pyramimonas_sp.AAC.1
MPEITDTSAGPTPACPICKVGKLVSGRYPRDKVWAHGPDDDDKDEKRPRSTKPGSRPRLPIQEKDRERSPRH